MIEIEEIPGGLTKLALIGRIDFAGAQTIEEPMRAHAAQGHAVVVDLSRVDFIASMGLRILITFAKTIRAKGGRVALLGPRRNVADVIRVSGVDELIPIFAGEEEALAAVVPA
jgi:anti-anti-sigma factor